MPDDDQDGAGDGDQRLELAAAADQPPVAFAEEGVGLGGRGGDLPECAPQVRVAFAGRPGAVLGARLDGLGRDLGPGDQVAGAGAPAPLVGPGSGPSAGTWAAGIAAIASSIRVVSWSSCAVSPSIWSSRILARRAWWSLNWPVSASTSAARLTRSRPRASSASTFGS